MLLVCKRDIQWHVSCHITSPMSCHTMATGGSYQTSYHREFCVWMLWKISWPLAPPLTPINTVNYSANLWYGGDILQSIFFVSIILMYSLAYSGFATSEPSLCESWQCTGQRVGHTKANVIAVIFSFSIDNGCLTVRKYLAIISDVFQTCVCLVTFPSTFAPKMLPLCIISLKVQ